MLKNKKIFDKYSNMARIKKRARVGRFARFMYAKDPDRTRIFNDIVIVPKTACKSTIFRGYKLDEEGI